MGLEGSSGRRTERQELGEMREGNPVQFPPSTHPEAEPDTHLVYGGCW